MKKAIFLNLALLILFSTLSPIKLASGESAVRDQVIENFIEINYDNKIYLPLVFGKPLSYEQKILKLFSSDIIAYYPMAEKSGTFIVDINGDSGEYTNGNIIGPVVFGGRGIGIFPSSDSYINIPTEMINPKLNDFSVMFFLQSTNEVISANLLPFIFYKDADNLIYMARGRTSGNYASYHKANELLNYIRLGVIQHTYPLHIAVTYTAGKGMRTYVNGTHSQYTPDLQLIDGLLTYARIGGNGAGTGWQGFIHDFVIVGREVTMNEAKIAAEYDNTQINTQIIAEGDSRTDGSAWVPKVHESIYDNEVISGYAIHAKSGSTLGEIESRATELDTALINGSRNILIVWAGVNNYTWSANAIHSALAAYCSARKAAGWTVVVSTEIDAQTERHDQYHWHDTTWPNLNALIRENWSSYADALVDLGANSHLQDATNTTYFIDRLHLTLEGQAVVANEMIPVINSVIETMNK